MYVLSLFNIAAVEAVGLRTVDSNKIILDYFFFLILDFLSIFSK